MWTNPSYILRDKSGLNKPSLSRIQSELKCARVTGVIDPFVAERHAADQLNYTDISGDIYTNYLRSRNSSCFTMHAYRRNVTRIVHKT